MVPPLSSLAAIALSCLVACSARTTADRDALKRKALDNPMTAYRDYRLLSRRYGIPVSFWPDSALSDSLAGAGADGPCGPEHTLWVRQLRPLPPRHSLDAVIEYDDARVLGSWSTPANDVPRGISGNTLLFALQWYAPSAPVDSARLPVLRVGIHGELAVGRLPGSLPPVEPENCPAHALMPGSDFWSCYRFVDLRTRQVRRLGFNEMCT